MPESTQDPELRFPWWYRRPRLVDTISLIVALAPAVTGIIVAVASSRGLRDAVPAMLVIVGVLLSKRWPRAALFLVAAAPVICWPLDIDPTLAWTLVVLAAPILTLRGPSALLVAIVGSIANGFGQYMSDISDPSVVGLGVTMALVVATTATTAALQKQSGYLRAMEQRAEDALEARDREAARRVIEERLRIARDLHDVVGHEVALVSVQLSMAEVAISRDEAGARTALAEARGGIQSILHEMQRILEVLRFSEGADSEQPTGGIDELAALLASFRGIGMDVDADLDTIDVRVDAAVGTAVYRVLQEALTNAQRHGTGRTTVTLRYDAAGDDVEIRISNPIAAHAQSGSGYGLLGMRERVESAGGTLTLSDHDGQFTVSARLRTTGARS